MQFSDLQLSPPLLQALADEGYVSATPIQAAAIPHALAGRDVLGSAQTGTGKTAAFALPVLQRLSAATSHGAATSHSAATSHGSTTPHAGHGGLRRARCVVLCPTRELATQIGDGFRAYGAKLHLRHTVIFGGVNQYRQVDSLRRGVDIVIATPGRFLDLFRQGHVDLSGIEIFVLDEADRMLDMGFIHDIRTIVQQLPEKRQTMLFSATMPREIAALASALLKNPARVEIASVAATRALIEESVYFVDKAHKPKMLAHLVDHLPMHRSIVFTRTKHGADRVVKHLHAFGIRSEAIHGNKSQNNRQRALDNFKAGKIPVLVATDIASRGIDVDDISHVVNFDLTHEPETYLHRIGRTGRAGATGHAISLVDREEMGNLRAIEKLIGRKVPVKTDAPAFAAQPSHGARHTEQSAAARGALDNRGASNDRGASDEQRPPRQRTHHTRDAQASQGTHAPKRSHRSDGPFRAGGSHHPQGLRDGARSGRPMHQADARQGHSTHSIAPAREGFRNQPAATGRPVHPANRAKHPAPQQGRGVKPHRKGPSAKHPLAK